MGRMIPGLHSPGSNIRKEEICRQACASSLNFAHVRGKADLDTIPKMVDSFGSCFDPTGVSQPQPTLT